MFLKGGLLKNHKSNILNRKNIYISSILILFLFVAVFYASDKAKSVITKEGDTIFSDEVKIKTGDDYSTVRGYSSFNWTNIQSIMSSTQERLIKQYGINWNDRGTLGGSLNNLNPNNKPEGQVWVYDGDLSVSGAVSGKGTIIIRDGKLTIDGDLYYANENDNNNSIGFIVLNGNIIVASNVTRLVGAYYSNNQIIVQ